MEFFQGGKILRYSMAQKSKYASSNGGDESRSGIKAKVLR